MSVLLPKVPNRPDVFDLAGAAWDSSGDFQKAAAFILNSSSRQKELCRLAARFRTAPLANPRGEVKIDLQCMLEQVVPHFQPVVVGFEDWFDTFNVASSYLGQWLDSFTRGPVTVGEQRKAVAHFVEGPNLRILVTRVKMLLGRIRVVSNERIDEALSSSPFFDSRFHQAVFEEFAPEERCFEAHFELEVCQWLIRETLRR